MILYVVTSGAYSSYGIRAIFSTRMAAEFYIGDRRNDISIEEFLLDPSMELAMDGWHGYQITMRRNGDVISAYELRWPHETVLEVYHDASYAKIETIAHLADSTEFSLNAKTKEQAIKSANERRAMLLALDEWGKCLEASVANE